MTLCSAGPGGTLVLDSEGFAKAVLRDRTVTGWLALARADDLRVIISAATLVEVIHPRINRPAAAALLADAGLHGHKHTIDAMLSVKAERRQGGSACCALMSPSLGAGP